VDADVAIAPLRSSDDKVVTAIAVLADVTEQTRSERALRESEARLRESEARYRAVVDDQVELVCRYTADTTITFVNRAFADFYGRRHEELVGSPLIDLRAPAERAAELARLDEFGAGAEVATYDEWEFGADGVPRWYRWTDRAFLDANGAVVEFQSVGHDVTEEHRALLLTTNQTDILEQIARGVSLDETLRAIAGTVEAHFPRLACAVFQLDFEVGTLRLGGAASLARRFATSLDGTVVRENATSCAEAVIHREPVYVEDATVDPRCAQLHELAREQGLRGAWSTPIIASDACTVLGTIAVYARERSAPDDEHRRIFSLVAHLASIAIERKEFENRLAREFMHDPLTHLPNRLLFIDRLSQAVARGQRTHADVAVLFLDLDRFKNVNDSLGHDAGDELLVAVARRLEAVLRPGDTVARFGGDEFTILCEDLPHDAARDRAVEIAQRLLTSVDRPFAVRMTETFVGISIGIALTATGDETPDELLREADAAMYHAKEIGRGRAEVFDDTMRARALARHANENALHRAIDGGELRMFFQPIVSLHTARCVGAESLVRWQHAERGLLLPADFVPLAEDSGLILPLGAWVLEQAAAQAARWQLAADVVVSVNLSARQMAEPALAERVAAVLESTGARPESLCFEITETALMEDADAMRHVIETVRALGVHFSIDDFGTGYSSLGYLKRFSVDSVKIDRTFVESIADDEDDRAIVSAVIGLAHALGLRVVAEGVEREPQLAELVALGCDEAQGYFFAPPQPGDDLAQLVSRTRHWRPPGAPLMGGF
jgi:diguanylate cyclase (GGDEF)-like protein/PAS domain S-box-containing protein